MEQFNNAASVVESQAIAWLKVGVASNRGKVLDHNEDAIFALTSLLPNPNSGKVMPFGFFAVADGMGGLNDGGSASGLAVRLVANKVVAQLLAPALAVTVDNSSQPILADLLRDAFESASAQIYDSAKASGKKSGTTMIAALLLGRQLTLAHAGDSRIYLATANGLEALTRDHSVAARLEELGDLPDGPEVPSRNQLYRALGLQARLECDIITRNLFGCTHLVLCSDGLWGSVSKDEIAAALRENSEPQAAADELVRLANQRGGGDNISVIVVELPVAR